MASKSKIKISSNRSFGLVFFVVFLIIALWPLKYEEDIRLWSLVLSIIFFILGILNSQLLTPLNKLWFKFVHSFKSIKATIKKTIKNTNPKLLFDEIFILKFDDIIN